MNIVKLNGVKVYNLTSERSMPDWASRAEKKKLLKLDPKAESHIELIHELDMPDASTYITCSPDQEYLFVLGRYKPRVKCFELKNLSLKFDRCVDYLPKKMACISEDYSKFALLEEERWIDLHAAGGHYFRFRIPMPGTDITYCNSNCNLFIPSAGNYIYRMDLKEGRFNTPFNSPKTVNNGFTSGCLLNELDVLLAASTNGWVEGWDLRCGERAFSLDVFSTAPRPNDVKKYGRYGCSTLAKKDPLNFAVGVDEGSVHLYDVRQFNRPWHTRDTEYRNPIKTIAFHEDKIITLVSNCLKIWYLESGKIFVGFDTGPIDVNWMYHFNSSGLIMLANESPKINRYFIPLLGEAPYWCSYLDQMVIECEPDVVTMYDGYNFLTRQQLLEHGMLDLIGTKYLRAYMHGYFISKILFDKIQLKLGLNMTENKNKLKTGNSSQPSNTKSKDDVLLDEMDEAANDERFIKLKTEKLSNLSDENSCDLIKIHQSRLERKRKSKEARKLRAVRADNAIKMSKQE